MTERRPLPREDHFAKYFSHKYLIHDPPESDNVVGVPPQAIQPRPIDHGELSGNHLEWFTAATLTEKVFALSKHLADNKLLTVRRSGRFGVAAVAEIKVMAESAGIVVGVVEDPIEGPPADPSHALILGLPVEIHLVHEEIAKMITPYSALPVGASPPVDPSRS
jgi:hypothetical protein